MVHPPEMDDFIPSHGEFRGLKKKGMGEGLVSALGIVILWKAQPFCFGFPNIQWVVVKIPGIVSDCTPVMTGQSPVGVSGIYLNRLPVSVPMTFRCLSGRKAIRHTSVGNHFIRMDSSCTDTG